MIIGDDADAVEASLIENMARLDPDEVLGVRELRALAQQPQAPLSDEIQAQARRLALQLRKRLQSLQQHRWRSAPWPMQACSWYCWSRAWW